MLLAACGPSPAPAASSNPGCVVRLPALPAATDMPGAILRDVAGGPSEYLAGSPGGRVVKLGPATGFSPPQVGGGSVFFSVRHGQTAAIYRGMFGGCATRLVEGTLGAVQRQGHAFTALLGDHWTLLDADGRQVVRLTGAAGAWTEDGRLVEPTVGGVDVFTVSGKKRSLPLKGVSPLSPLGTHQELVATATGVMVMDLDSGTISALNLGGQQVLRAPSGSPDGTRVAFLDANGSARILEVATGKLQPLTPSALPTGFAWSHDSAWVAVQAVYGGVELNVASGRLVDSGSLVVVSW